MNQHEHPTSRGSLRSHMLPMIIGCVAIMALILVVASFAPARSYAAYLMLLCPILHLLLHRIHRGIHH
jgi:hypothetical protein